MFKSFQIRKKESFIDIAKDPLFRVIVIPSDLKAGKDMDIGWTD